jgi:hypothetical protein
VLGNVAVQSLAQLNMLNASVSGSLTTNDTSTAQVLAGSIGGSVTAGDNSKLSLGSDVSISSNLLAQSGSNVTVINAQIDGDLDASGNSTTTMDSGRIDGNVVVLNDATVNLIGGTIEGSVQAHNSGIIDYSGGTIDGNQIVGSAVDLIDAGSFESSPLDSINPDALIAYDNATIDFFGMNYSSTLLNSNDQGQFSEYEISGILSNGTPFTTIVDLQNGSNASYDLLPPLSVPEPTALLSITAALFPFLLRRHCSREFRLECQ